MMGLWTDAWFYIPMVGLLVSGVLFFFLLGQYRLASEAADAGETDKEGDSASAVAISPVYSPSEAGPAPKVKAAEPERKTEAAPEAKTPDYSGPDRRKDPANTTGGVSPAVVYMQNIKSELTDLHEDVRKLSKRVDSELDAVSARDEALIERLAELTRAVEALKSAAAAAPQSAPVVPAAAEPAPAPKKEKAPKKEPAPKAEPAPAAIVDDLAGLVAPAPKAEPQPEPKPEPKPEPAQTIELKAEPAPAPKTETLSPDATIRLELGSSMGVPKTAEPEKVTDAAAEPAPEEKPRRGPVWPV